MGSRLDRAFAVSVALGIALALAGVAAGFTTARAEAIERIDATLAVEAQRERTDVEEYFERSRSIMLIAAQNPSFTALYVPGATSEERVAAQGPEVEQVNASLAYLEELFPGRIGEACFIDVGGAENARVVRGTTATPAELSADESANPFFAPTLGLAPGEVYHAAPYRSPDTGEWVISNSTVIVAPDGRTRGMLHFEVTVESVRRQLRSDGHESLIVDGATGRVVASDRAVQTLGGPLGRPADARFAGVGPSDGPVGRTIDGRRYATVSIARGPANANEWIIAVGQGEPLGAGIGFGFGEVALVVLGAGIAVAALAARRAHLARLRDALVDDLTGLPSRRQLLEAEGRLSAPGSTAVLMIDLDRFKEVNDTLGHRQGDALLRLVADRLRARVAADDVLARLGGDEFAVLATRPAPEDLVRLSMELHDAVDEPFHLDGLPVHVGASVGMALTPEHGTTLDALVQHADVAMYDAKHRNLGSAVYDATRDPHSPARLTLAAELRGAIRDGAVTLHYQPKVDLATGRTVGLEALARWTSRDGRVVPPDEFIPLAERSGLMTSLTRRLLDVGLDQLATWREMGLDLILAVNVSASSLLERTFTPDVADALRRHGVPPGSLILELTESTVMDDPARSLRVLEELRHLGVRLSIDDFGTGYSSLSYLQRLPVGELKIDRGFVHDLDVDSDRAIVRATIELGHSLGLSVVAEGVEEAGTLERLRDLGCDLAQGYFLSRPADAGTMTDWLLAHPVPLLGGGPGRPTTAPVPAPTPPTT